MSKADLKATTIILNKRVHDGSLDLSDLKGLKTLGNKLEIIIGSLCINRSDIESTGSLKIIGGHFMCWDDKLKEMPELEYSKEIHTDGTHKLLTRKTIKILENASKSNK